MDPLSHSSSEASFTVEHSTQQHDQHAVDTDSSADEDEQTIAAAASSSDPCCSVCFAQPAISPRSAAAIASTAAADTADDDESSFVYCGECRRSYCVACDADFHARTNQTQHFRQAATGFSQSQQVQPPLDLSALIWDDLNGSSSDEDEARLVLQLNGTYAHDDGAKLPVQRRATRVLAAMPLSSGFHPSLQRDPYETQRSDRIVSPRSPSVRKQHMYRGGLNAAAEASAFAASTAAPPAAPAFAPLGPKRPLSASTQQRPFVPLAPSRSAAAKAARPNSARIARTAAAPRIVIHPPAPPLPPPPRPPVCCPSLGARDALPPRSWGQRCTPASMLELHSEMARLKTLLISLKQQRTQAAAINQRKLAQIAALTRTEQEFSRMGSAAMQRPRQRSESLNRRTSTALASTNHLTPAARRELEEQIAVWKRENAALSASVTELESSCLLRSDVAALGRERAHWVSQLELQRSQHELQAFKQSQLVEDLKAAAEDLTRALKQKEARLQSALAAGNRAHADADRLELEYADLQHALDRSAAKQMQQHEAPTTMQQQQRQPQPPPQPRSEIRPPQPPSFSRLSIAEPSIASH